jgi:ATP-binding cassette, subfamily B (MDR/TAP), member 1
MYEEATQVANDAVSGIRTIASFCAEPKVMKTYYGKCKAPVRQGIRQGVVSGLGFGVSFFVLYSTYALCFYVGANFMLDGKATFTDVFRVSNTVQILSFKFRSRYAIANCRVLLQVFFALLMATIGVSQTSALGPNSAKAKASASTIFALIDSKSNIDPSSDEGMVLADVTGELELRHICFSYPSRPGTQIFRDLNLRIPSGKVRNLSAFSFIVLLRSAELLAVTSRQLTLTADGCACRGERLRQIHRHRSPGEVLRP